jgi:hypothetical protein
MRRIVRLTYRMHRFEVTAFVLAAGLLVAAALATSWRLDGVGHTAGCSPSLQTGEVPPACEAKFREFQEIAAREGAIVGGLATIFPVIAGLLVGGPLIAREIERGTARLAWSLSPSRLRWFSHRVLPVLGLLVVVLFLVGFAADRLAASLSVGTDMSVSFVGFRSRGVLLATQGVLVAATAIGVGAVLGRAVPTLFITFVLGTLLVTAIGSQHAALLVNETVRQADQTVFDPDDLQLDYRFALPDGRLLTWNEIVAEDPSREEFGVEYPSVALVIPGERYREVETREAAAHVAVALLFVVGAAGMVSRRKPA